MRRVIFLVAAVAGIGIVTAITSVPAGEWKMYPTFATAFAAVIVEWLLFWRTPEREESRRIVEQRRRDLERRSLCTSCGYSLTGNVSGTCPECGTRTGPRAS